MSSTSTAAIGALRAGVLSLHRAQPRQGRYGPLPARLPLVELRHAAYQALVALEDEPEFLAAIRDATNGGFALVGDSVKSRLPAERQPRLARRRPGPAPDPAPQNDDITAELGLRPRTS